MAGQPSQSCCRTGSETAVHGIFTSQVVAGSGRFTWLLEPALGVDSRTSNFVRVQSCVSHTERFLGLDQPLWGDV